MIRRDVHRQLSRGRGRRPRRFVLVVGLLVWGAIAPHGLAAQPAEDPRGASVPTPTVEGPITGGMRTGGPQSTSLYDLEPFGYVEEEFFFSGDARDDGTDEGTTAPYKTRMLVRRPADPARFNGTVVLEWDNVTLQTDLEGIWAGGFDMLMRDGYIYVGVSAQKQGVDGSPLSSKVWDPQRYGSLSHPGDDYSFDIYSQAGKALLAGDPSPLGGAVAPADRPLLLIAAGSSQSGGRLLTYINSFHEHAQLYDAFNPTVSGVSEIRDDLVPILWVNTESEALTGGHLEDSGLYRMWEVAGGSHQDARNSDYGTVMIERDQTGVMNPTFNPDPQYGEQGQERPCKNLFPWRWARNASIAVVDQWTRTGEAPPSLPRYERDANGRVVRDDDLNVVGGVRLPPIDVPVASYLGDMCPLNGSTFRFSEDKLRALYPTHDDYVTKICAAAQSSVAAGVLLPEDAEILLARAQAAPVPSAGDAAEPDPAVCAFGEQAPVPPGITRVAGTGRTETAVEISRETHAESAGAVILARDDQYADALAGGPLALKLDGPLLLTASDALSAATRAELDRLAPTEIVLLGGTAALSGALEADVRASYPTATVRRVRGPDRFATAAEIAGELGDAAPIAFVTEGRHPDPARGWPDALSASPSAAFTGRPILLTDRDTLPDATLAALDALGTAETVVVGGPGAVSDAVVERLRAEGHGPRRVAGATRYETSVAVVEESIAAGMALDRVWLATGLNFPDALAAGPAVAAAGDVLLLVDGQDLSRSAAARDFLAARAGDIDSVVVLGGRQAISDDVAREVAELIGE